MEGNAKILIARDEALHLTGTQQYAEPVAAWTTPEMAKSRKG